MILAFSLALACLLIVGLWFLVVAGEKGRVRARRWKMGLEDVRGFLLHPGLFYHPGHTWVMPQGNGTVRIGIDDFSRRLVDGVVKVELPPKGSRVRQGRVAVQLDCGEKRARLLSPVSGLVTAVNDSLAKGGSALERDPYGKGWLFTAEVANQRFKKLPTGAAATEWLKREIGRLSVFLQGELGVTAADGGDLIPKPPRVLSKEQWENLVETFFHTSEKGKIEG